MVKEQDLGLARVKMKKALIDTLNPSSKFLLQGQDDDEEPRRSCSSNIYSSILLCVSFLNLTNFTCKINSLYRLGSAYVAPRLPLFQTAHWALTQTGSQQGIQISL